MDAKIIQPCAEGHLLSLQFLVTNYIFFLNKIMYTASKKCYQILQPGQDAHNCLVSFNKLLLKFFFLVKMKLLTFFRLLLETKQIVTDQHQTHLEWKCEYFCHFTQQIMFWNLSSLEKLLHIFLWHGKIWTLYTCCKYLPVFVSTLLQNIFQYVFF